MTTPSWHVIATRGGTVDIIGPCESACTLVMAHIPKDRLCFGQHARLGFHQARLGDAPSPQATKEMFDCWQWGCHRTFKKRF
jgi:hypothetical protein